MEAALWAPSPERRRAAQATQFMNRLNAEFGLALVDYAALHRWSLDHPELFWKAVWEF